MTADGAEFPGTFWLVPGGCGSAVLSAAFPHAGLGLHCVSLAFGLAVLTMACAIGHVSGRHLNPAVSVGPWAGGRFPAGRIVPCVIAQVLGAIAAGGVLLALAQRWLFRLAPIAGAVPGAVACRAVAGGED